MKADLHFYGLIGFQPHWRNVQGYAGDNLAVEIVRNAKAKELDIIALTSMHDAPEGIPRDSIHDRFGMFQDELAQNKTYRMAKLGQDLLEITRPNNGKPLFVLNAQKVVTYDSKNGNSRADIVVVGSNQFKNGYTTEELIAKARESGCITIATSDVRGETIESHALHLDAMAHTGHNLPIVGQNAKKWKLAQSVSLPGIAVSGAKLPTNVGSAYTDFNFTFREGTDKQILSHLRNSIECRRYTPHRGYENPIDALNTHRLFLKYTKPRIRESYGV